MAYNPTNWVNGQIPITESNMNKIETELGKLDPATPYTEVSGTYTTAVWASGTNNCVWTAPRTGLYIIFSRFDLDDDSNAQIYKQLQLKGTATRINGDLLLYQTGPTTATSSHLGISIFTGATLVYAQQGQTIIPYIHTPKADIVWYVKLAGLFLK
jgi:hypothetical protein